MITLASVAIADDGFTIVVAAGDEQHTIRFDNPDAAFDFLDAMRRQREEEQE